MMRKHSSLTVFIAAIFCAVLLSGCAGSTPSQTSSNMTLAYAFTTLISLLIVIAYCAFVRQKNLWVLLLFVSVFVVNIGYLSLSMSKTLEEALLANRISYLGSVFLPLCMFICILDICRISYQKWFLGILLVISFSVFLLAASPGYLSLYYKDVSLIFIDGMAKLQKVYGPLHFVYMVYLLAYFSMMSAAVLFSLFKKNSVSFQYAVQILLIVFLNMSIWYIERHVSSIFEFLSVSYIASELVLNGIIVNHRFLTDYIKPIAPPAVAGSAADEISPPPDLSPEEKVIFIIQNWQAVSLLTQRETDVLEALLLDKKRKDIAAELFITEHTVKKHTANIFSKLDVSNRNELFQKAEQETFR